MLGARPVDLERPKIAIAEQSELKTCLKNQSPEKAMVEGDARKDAILVNMLSRLSVGKRRRRTRMVFIHIEHGALFLVFASLTFEMRWFCNIVSISGHVSSPAKSAFVLQ